MGWCLLEPLRVTLTTRQLVYSHIRLQGVMLYQPLSQVSTSLVFHLADW